MAVQDQTVAFRWPREIAGVVFFAGLVPCLAGFSPIA
jgi:hypothetical protein